MSSKEQTWYILVDEAAYIPDYKLFRVLSSAIAFQHPLRYDLSGLPRHSIE